MELESIIQWVKTNPFALLLAGAVFAGIYHAKAPVNSAVAAIFARVIVPLVTARIERAERHQKQRLAIELREADARIEFQRIQTRALELENQQRRVETELLEQLRGGGIQDPSLFGCPADAARRTGKHRIISPSSPPTQPDDDG